MFADSGYRGAQKRPEAKPGVSWQIARRPSSRKPFENNGKLRKIIDEIEHLKASVRAKVDLQYTIYALIKTNEFPRPVKVRWVSRWVREEISDWIRALMLKRQ